MPTPDVWKFYEALAETSRADLTSRQRGVAAICDLRQEVASGGFDCYFSYWGGDTAQEALEALPTSLGQDWAVLLSEAMDLLGSPYPTDQGSREARVDSLGPDDPFAALDQRLYDLEAVTDADDLLSALLREPA